MTDAIHAPALNVQLHPCWQEIGARVDGGQNVNRDEARAAAMAVFDGMSLEVSAALSGALDAWRREEAEALRRDLEASPFAGWAERFKRSVDGGRLDGLRDAVRNHNKLAQTVKTLLFIKSFTVTMSLEVELGVNLGLSAMFALDAIDWNYATVSVSGVAGAGEEAGFLASESFGVSGAAPDDAGGLAVGVAGDFVVGIGVTAEASVAVQRISVPPYWMIQPLQWALSVGGALGIAEGVDLFFEAGVVLGAIEFPPMEQPVGNKLARIAVVRCDELQDNNNKSHDEIYLTFVPDTGSTTYRFPTWGHYSIKITKSTDDYWRPWRTVWFNSSFKMTLHQGSHTLKTWTVSQPLPATLHEDSTEKKTGDQGFAYNYRYHDTTELFNEIDYKIRVDIM